LASKPVGAAQVLLPTIGLSEHQSITKFWESAVGVNVMVYFAVASASELDISMLRELSVSAETNAGITAGDITPSNIPMEAKL
jgi:hypothetical protein